MSLTHGWRRLLRLTLRSSSIRRDVDDELAFHLSMREEKLRALGASDDTARVEARERFGDRAHVLDECVAIDERHAGELRFKEWLESVWSDLRYAARMLRRTPAFTVVATLTLAVGIGATSAMFTLVDDVLLRPLPYPDADRIVRVIQSYPEKGLDTWGLSQQNLALYRDRASDFSAFAGYRNTNVTLNADGRVQRLDVARVTADFFNVVGINPSIGRAFTRAEDAPGRNNVAVLSYGLWQTRFGGRNDVLGSTVDLDGQPIRIVGVMPRGFEFHDRNVAAWLPMGLDPTRRYGWFNSGVGRLKPGITVAHARQQTTAIMWDWARVNASIIGPSAIDPARTRMATIVTPLQTAITRDTRKPLIVLLAAVSLVLLIAVANVATLLSGRAAIRQREIGLRTALGATGARVIRQLLTESIALALLGAVAGVALAVGAVRIATHAAFLSLPRRDEIHVDGRVLAVTLAISVASGLLFGLLPAVHALGARHTADLSAGVRDTARRKVRRANDALVVAQLSLSIMLLVAAGLMLKSFQRLTATDLGFRPAGITAITLPLPRRYNSAASANPLFATLLTRVRSIPGVKAAALAWGLPYEGQSSVDGYLVQGRPVPPQGNETQIVQTGVSPGYFATLGIPLLYGRDFGAADDTSSVPVAIVDETVAKRYWTRAEALGKRIRVTGDTTWLTIVGVVGAVHDGDAAAPLEPHMYVSLAQQGSSRVTLAVRSDDAEAPVNGALGAIRDVEPLIPLDGVRPFSSLIDRSLDTRRLAELLLGAFASIAVLLAGIGIYGVMSLSVANRRREFGVRLAIGAQPSALIGLVLREGATLATLGIGLGLLGALVATRWLTSLLYEVSPTDPSVFASLALLLAAIALASCYLPARRAAKSDPLIALRDG